MLMNSSGSTIFQIGTGDLTESQQQLLLFYLSQILQEQGLGLGGETFNITDQDLVVTIPGQENTGNFSVMHFIKGLVSWF